MIDFLDPLRRHFGHISFRAGQEDLVRAVVEGRDVLAVTDDTSGFAIRPGVAIRWVR